MNCGNAAEKEDGDDNSDDDNNNQEEKSIADTEKGLKEGRKRERGYG